MNGGEQGAMNPMMMMSLLEDKSCALTNEALIALDLEDSVKEEIAAGKKIWNGSEAVDASEAQPNADFINFVDYGFQACGSSSGGMGDLLPLMMQGGQGAGQMDPMMMLSLLEGGDMSEMLPLMMMGQGGEQGAMNPMMMMSMLDGDSKSKDACNKKFKLTAFSAEENNGEYTLKATTEAADVQAFFESQSFENDYTTCLSEATEQSGSKDSSMKELLPLMMMNGGGAMDPMTMMMMLE